MSLAYEFGIAFFFAVIAGVLFEAIKSTYTVDFKLYIKKNLITFTPHKKTY